MDCDFETFTNELLGNYGFKISDWVYLTQINQMEKSIQYQMDIRDGFNPLERKTK